MKTEKKKLSGHSDGSNIVDKHQLAAFRAEKSAPSISKRDVDLVFSTPEARRELAVQEDIAAFGSLIRNLRRGAGFTQLELSKKAGVSRATIANLEAGCLEGGPRLGTLAQLVRACGAQLLPSTARVSDF